MDSIYIIFYFISSILFILGIKMLSSPTTARRGNFISFLGMIIAVTTTLLIVNYNLRSIIFIASGIFSGGIIGLIFAKKVQMTSMPQMVAIFNGLGGLASSLIAFSEIIKSETTISLNIISVSILISILIGSVTFSGSITGFLKLQSLITGKPILIPLRNYLNFILLISIIALMITSFFFVEYTFLFYILIGSCLLLGILIVLPIGGADMPVVISMLNSYSGWAAAGIGFTLENTALIITGALVGSSGAILSYIMCKGMNRSFFNVILGGWGATDQSSSNQSKEQRPVKSGNADDAAFLMKNASSVIIVPGYGMAVAQAQHALREMVDALKKNGVKVTYAIHPVAGRMPGHMNVLLAEANVPYDEVFELEEINNDFANCDVAYVIGANDVTNPVAKTDPQSPIYGMPILDVEKSKSVLFVKRSLSPGYAGIDNDLFYRDNTLMLFADAKKMTEDIIKSL